MFRNGLFLFLLLFSALIPQGFSSPALNVSLSKNKIHTNESTQLSIQILWPKSEGSYSFAVPDLPLQLLTVTNQAESQESFMKGNEEWSKKVFSYELTPKEAGEGSLENFTLGYVAPASGATGEFHISAVQIQIAKTKASWNISPLGFVFIGISVLGGLGGGFFLLKSKKSPPPPELSLKEKFVSEIKSKISSVSSFSSDALVQIDREFQKFLSDTYQIKAAGHSESEMLDSLKQKKLSADELKTIGRILNQIREAKYTGQKLNDMDFQILKKEITAFIDSKYIINSLSSAN